MNILFFGDLYIKDELATARVFSEFQTEIQNSDISFVNFEAPVPSNNCRPIKKNGPALKMKDIATAHLGGIDVVGLANNHIMDYGRDGLINTVQLLETLGAVPIGYVLDGRNFHTITKNINGRTVSFSAFAEEEFNFDENSKTGASLFSPLQDFNYLRSVVDNADINIIYLHTGVEYTNYPFSTQREWVKFLCDIGFDVVVCSHSHMPGVTKKINNSVVCYSLGNSFFSTNLIECNTSFALSVTVDFLHQEKSVGYEIIPFERDVDKSVLRKLTHQRKAEFLKDYDTLVQMFIDGSYRGYRAEQIRKYRNFHLLSIAGGVGATTKRKILNTLGRDASISAKKELRIKNYLRTPSLRDLVGTYLGKGIEHD